MTVNTYASELREGMPVYTADGNKMGQIGEVNLGTSSGSSIDQISTEERTFFQVKRGLLNLGGDLWLSAEAIERVRDEGVALRYTEDEAERQGWGTKP